MPKFKLTLSYDGTEYSGWQVQSNAQSIQSLIQSALTTVLRAPTNLTGSGRTDAGVHALAQVAHFEYAGTIDFKKTLLSLNGILPLDIRVLKIEETADDFHARYSASGKIYHYHLHLDSSQNPFKRLYSTHVLHKVDLPLLIEAARYFVGTHDFTSFANEAHEGSAAKNPVRTIYRLDCVPEPGGIRLEFEGDGFLYKMVRNIVGTLLEIASHKISLEELVEIFQAKDRKRAGKAAPAQGLFLVEVKYQLTQKKESESSLQECCHP